MALQIQGEEENFQLTNIYARDSQLKCAALIELFSTFPKLILVGDLNAKHHQLLPHSQLVPHNTNDKELHSFMEGRDTLSANPVQAHIHNSTCPSEWTHFTEQGTHSLCPTVNPLSSVTSPQVLLDLWYLFLSVDRFLMLYTTCLTLVYVLPGD